MEVDESALTRFFGSPPVDEDPEEQECFGSVGFQAREGPLTLTVDFGRVHGDVSVSLQREHDPEPFFRAVLHGIAAATVAGEPPLLQISGAARGTRGADPDLVARALISLHPIKVSVQDGL